MPDTGDAFRNGDTRQACAAVEDRIPDTGDAIWNGDTRQAAA